MRFSVSPMVALAAALLLADAASAAQPARELRLPIGGKGSTCTNISDKGGEIPNVARGQFLGIACSEAARNGVDVRVVMQFGPIPGEAPLGIGALLATEQKVKGGLVRVKVPTLPEIANHTADVKVYVIDKNGTSSCEAGRVKIM